MRVTQRGKVAVKKPILKNQSSEEAKSGTSRKLRKIKTCSILKNSSSKIKPRSISILRHAYILYNIIYIFLYINVLQKGKMQVIEWGNCLMTTITKDKNLTGIDWHDFIPSGQNLYRNNIFPIDVAQQTEFNLVLYRSGLPFSD